MKRIAVLLADGFEEVEAITPIDFLRRAGVEVPVVGVTGDLVTGGHSIRVRSDIVINQVDDQFIANLDGVVVPGGTDGAENIAANDRAMGLIRHCLDAGKLVAALCAAPGVVLGANGLLTGRRFTCYPGFETRVENGEFSEDRVVVDGNLITSRGPGTAAEFTLAIIRYLVGEEASSNLHRRTLQPG
ncbi:MAG: DJ-1/PfpI family protein [Spirochaetales bacterium]|nr:DJ-1/PfpI family protein [Spirochaetales bacterium]